MNLFGDDEIIYDDEREDEDSFFSDEDSYEASAELHEKLPTSSRESYEVLGHQKIENQFIEFFEKNKFPHAMIFSGPKGIGKASMAYRLTRFLFKHGKEQNTVQDALFGGDEMQMQISSLAIAPDDPVFRRVLSGGHADLLVIEREIDTKTGKQDKDLKVDNLRKIEPFLRKTSSEGGWRVVLIDDADTMNRAAQNAILKILEEPPSKVIIILVAHRLGTLIPTIRSRSRLITFDPLSEEEMRDLLLKYGHGGIAGKEFDRLMALSQGSFGNAMELLEGGGLEMLSRLFIILDQAPNWKWSELNTLADELGSAQALPQFLLFSSLLQWLFRQVLFYKARGQNALPSYLNHDALNHLVCKSSLERLIDISDQLKNHFDRYDFSNLDRRDAVRGAFLVLNG